MRIVLPASRLLALAFCLAACERSGPYMRPGEWHPLGANAANLAAMVADPKNLDEGTAAPASAGDMAAAAVARLRADAVKRLPATSLSDLRIVDTGSSPGNGGAASPAAPVASPGTATGMP